MRTAVRRQKCSTLTVWLFSGVLPNAVVICSLVQSTISLHAPPLHLQLHITSIILKHVQRVGSREQLYGTKWQTLTKVGTAIRRLGECTHCAILNEICLHFQCQCDTIGIKEGSTLLWKITPTQSAIMLGAL